MEIIWHSAFDCLRSCEKIYFIGYSFPETDAQTKVLVSSALRKNDKLKEIIVVSKEKDLFNWNEIPGNDNRRFIEFLRKNFGIEWVKTAKIEKIYGDNTIRVFNGKNSLSLKLNDEGTKATIKIDDGRIDEFVLETENGKLNVYDKKNTKEDFINRYKSAIPIIHHSKIKFCYKDFIKYCEDELDDMRI